MGIVSPWESHCQSPDSSLPAQTCEFNFSHPRRHRAASVIKRKQEETICCEERPQQIVTRFSGLWSHFQVSNLHVHIWILSYPTCGSDLRVEELRRNTNVHAGVNRESLFVIFIGVIYCFPSDKCSLLSGYKTFRVDVEGAPFCFSAKSVVKLPFTFLFYSCPKSNRNIKCITSDLIPGVWIKRFSWLNSIISLNATTILKLDIWPHFGFTLESTTWTSTVSWEDAASFCAVDCQLILEGS